MKEWMRRNWLVVLALVGVFGLEANVIICARTAHAQKPAEQPKTAQQIAAAQIADQVIQKLGEQPVPIVVRADTRYRAVGDQLIGPWIEQHCVAVMAQTDDELMHKPGTELKLRCKADEPHK